MQTPFTKDMFMTLCTCCVLWGCCVIIVFSAGSCVLVFTENRVYLCSLWFVCTLVCWFSENHVYLYSVRIVCTRWVRMYLLCSLGFVCSYRSCVLFVFTGVRVYLCSL